MSIYLIDYILKIIKDIYFVYVCVFNLEAINISKMIWNSAYFGQDYCHWTHYPGKLDLQTQDWLFIVLQFAKIEITVAHYKSPKKAN